MMMFLLSNTFQSSKAQSFTQFIKREYPLNFPVLIVSWISFIFYSNIMVFGSTSVLLSLDFHSRTWLNLNYHHPAFVLFSRHY